MRNLLSNLWCFRSENSNESTNGGGDRKLKVYTLKELHAATNGFHQENKIGEGWYGIVYLGRTGDGDQIAIKKIKTRNSHAQLELMTEVDTICRLKHKNLLGFRGYCDEGDQRLMVCDYMPNLCLHSHLHGKNAHAAQLDWSRRLKVAFGTAEALMYLHHVAKPPIIHRDIKARNVLLGQDYDPVIADFRFSKPIYEGVSNVTTRVKGTLGYLAPEYAMTGKATASCDVYSFGILLLELLTGRKPIEKLPGGVMRTIIEWTQPLIEQGKFEGLVDPKLHESFDENQLKQVVKVAAMCVVKEPGKRPDMKEVVGLMKRQRNNEYGD